MSPQPLSSLLHTVKADGLKLFDFTVEAIDHRPDLSVHVMGTVATWASTEAELTRIAATLAKADVEIIARMLTALTSTAGQRAAIRAVVETALRDDVDGLEIFNAVQKAISSSRDQRNKYVHHLWAYWSGLPDALLLLPSAHVRIRDALHEVQLRKRVGWIVGGRTGVEPVIQNPAYDETKIMVYREEDVKRDLRDARGAAELVGKLQLALLPRGHASREQARTELLAEPQVQQALRPQGQKSTP